MTQRRDPAIAIAVRSDRQKWNALMKRLLRFVRVHDRGLPDLYTRRHPMGYCLLDPENKNRNLATGKRCSQSIPVFGTPHPDGFGLALQALSAAPKTRFPSPGEDGTA